MICGMSGRAALAEEAAVSSREAGDWAWALSAGEESVRRPLCEGCGDSEGREGFLHAKSNQQCRSHERLLDLRSEQ